jgi:hypothetical protein
MKIVLSDGVVVEISDTVVAMDPLWRERFRDLISARSLARKKARERACAST